jgi:2,3-dimethylmalate lyase
MSVRKKLRALLSDPELLVLPGAYDGLSARIIEAQGFKGVLAGGYAGIGSMLAEPDIGQSNMRDYAEHYARICGAVQLPVSVDADTGFGEVHNVRQTVRAFEAAGVAALTISDQVFPNRCGYLPGKQVVPVEQMLAKIKSAVDARRDQDLIIVGRTDCASILGFDEAIDRCHLFLEAGADMVKPMGADKLDDIERLVREVKSPIQATMSQAAGVHRTTFAQLQERGVAAVGLPSIALFAAARAVTDVLMQIKRDKSLAGIVSHVLPLDDYYKLVGLEAAWSREQKLIEEARALVDRFKARE